ncbi:MAG: hypothetical protein RLZZ360_823, partial [Candidatus Parcubacteria bacterium]
DEVVFAIKDGMAGLAVELHGV